MAALLTPHRWPVAGLIWLSSAMADPAVPPPAYQLAAQPAGVPAAALYAIALQESGIEVRGQRVPWPWSLNIAGQPLRFATRDAACRRLRQTLASEASSVVDVGLGQINTRFHGHRVTHPCELLDPYRNLTLAAEILREQYRPEGSWLDAIGRYHRPAGGAPARRYRQRVRQHLLSLADGQAVLTSAENNRP